MADECETRCPAECEDSWVFGRLSVRPTIQFGSQIEWLLHPHFADPDPHEFQLQVGHTGSNLSDDWQDVGLPAENVSILVDDQQRIFGQTQWTHYRVKLTTSLDTYYSKPQHTWGDLPVRYWNLLMNRERQWKLQLERTHRGQEGYLLKRKLTGEKPTAASGILDYQTEELVKPQSEETAGTEWLGGYYEPIPCVWVEPSKIFRREHLDAQARGTVNDIRVKSRMLATPQVDSYDVWVDRFRDFRWAIHGIEHEEEIRGVPVVISAEFRLLNFKHPAYKIEIPDML